MEEVKTYIDSQVSRLKSDIDNWQDKIAEYQRCIDDWRSSILDAEEKISNYKVAKEKVDA